MGNVTARYHVYLKDTSGTTLALFTNFLSISYTKRVNDVGSHEIEFLDNGDTRFALFGTDCRVEIWRKVPGTLNSYLDYQGFHRLTERRAESNGTFKFVSKGLDYNDLLARRVIAYKGGTVRAEKNNYAEDVMKEFVSENCGPDANHASRVRDGLMPNFTVAALGAFHTWTPNWSGKRSMQPLLDVLQEISNYSLSQAAPGVTPIDFQVVPNGVGFQFMTYYDQLGIDHRVGSADPTIFAYEFGNMSEIKRAQDRMAEVNAAIVLGMGEESTQKVVVRENATGIAASPWNDAETVVSETSAEFQYMLEKAGDAALKEMAEKIDFGGKPLQTGSTIYGLNYNIGDRVTIRYGTFQSDKKITEISVKYGESAAEEVDVTFSDLVP